MQYKVQCNVINQRMDLECTKIHTAGKHIKCAVLHVKDEQYLPIYLYSTIVNQVTLISNFLRILSNHTSLLLR
jgi:hypothetical protein